MPMLRTIKREWRVISGGGFFLAVLFLAVLAGFCYELYRAWAYGTIHPLPMVPTLHGLYCSLTADSGCLPIPSDRISLLTHPVLFFVHLGVLIALAIVVLALVLLFFWGWRIELQGLARRESQPPLDNAIRETTKR